MKVSMRLVKLSLAASIFVISATAAAAVEMTRPFEVLAQFRRAMTEFDKRQKGEEAERKKREKEHEAKRKREEVEQRKREAARKAEQEAQHKRHAAATTAAQDARPPSTSLPPHPLAAPALAHEPSTEAPSTPPQAQAAERQPLVQRAPPTQPQVGAQPARHRPKHRR